MKAKLCYRAVPIILFSLLLAFQANSQLNVPSPESFLGYKIGEHFTPHHKVMAYLKAVAAASDRVQFQTYGLTEEGRELVLLVVSSPENLSRLEQIRQDNLRLTDPRRLTTEAEAQRIIQSNPGILWLSYGVHGNESCSSEAAMKVVYHLASASDSETVKWLKELVILIDPMLNPDGRDRYVNFYNSVVGQQPNPDPVAAEHDEPWPGGRSNHYLFDLNRDWAWMTQKETQLRTAQYHRWRPHVHVDFHEMGYTSTYFFFPATRPINPILPDQVKKWGRIFGKGNAEMFDQHGIPYYTGESFDLFYPGYGDCYPSMCGAIGMTYEQGGGGFAGLKIRRPDGSYLSLRDRVNGHYLSSLGTIKTFANNRVERVKDFYQFWKDALNPSNLNGVRTVLIRPSRDQGILREFLRLMLNHGIEVKQATASFSVSATNYGERGESRFNFPKGTYFVDLVQPQSRLARVLLEPEAQKLDTLFFYDITSWALPYALNLDAAWSAKPVKVPSQVVDRLPEPESRSFPESKVGYLVRWGEQDAIRFLGQCYLKGIKVRMAHHPFKIDGQHYSRGTLVILKYDNRNDPNFYEKLSQIAKQSGIKVTAVKTAFTQEGVNLGSPKVGLLTEPKILLLRGSPTSSTAVGEIWHLFERQFGFPITLVNADGLARIDLDKFNVLILPPAYRTGYKSVLDSAMIKKLKTWMNRGGVIVGVESGAVFLSQEQSKLTHAALRKEEKKDKKNEKSKKTGLTPEEIQKRKRTVLQKQLDRIKERVPGTIVKVRLDLTHPLGYGMPSEAYVLKRNATVFELGDRGDNVGIYLDKARVTGYMSEKNMKKVNGGVFLYHERVGRGHAVMFIDDPNFRGFWRGLTQLFFNSVFLMANPMD